MRKTGDALPDGVDKSSLLGQDMTEAEMRLSAYHYFQRFIAARDTMFSKARQRQLTRLEFEQRAAIDSAAQTERLTLVKSEARQFSLVAPAVGVNSVALLLFVAYIIRQSKLRRRLESEQLRNRLSRGLHDDIGSTLSSIDILSRSA